MGIRAWLTNLAEPGQIRLLNVQLDKLFRTLTTTPKNEKEEGEFVTFPLSIKNGGTSASNAKDAREALGAAAKDHEHPHKHPVVFKVGEEILTGDTWINGKLIYKQVLQYEVTTLKSTINGPVIADFGEFISMTGKFYRPANGYSHQLNFYNDSSDHNYAYINPSGVLRLNTTHKATVTAIVEYTKSTD